MRFHTIVVDPPWKVGAGRTIGKYEMVDGKQIFGVVNNNSRPLSYPSLSIEQIASLPIGSIAEPDCHLYLWTINKYIPKAFDILRAWRFDYSTTLVWAKNPMGGGLGGAYGLATEFCLFARRGTLAARARIGSNWFNWKRPYDERGKPVHSAKPEEFFDMVERVSPSPRIELFARRKRVGWSVWGDEVESDVTFAPQIGVTG